MPLRQLLLRIMLWSLALAAATGVLSIFVNGSQLVENIIGTACATAAACILMMPVSTMIDRDRTRAAGLVGMSVILIEFLATLLIVWAIDVYFSRRWEDEIFLSMVAVAPATVAVMCFLWLVHVPRHGIGAKAGMWVCVASLAFVLLQIWVHGGSPRRVECAESAWAIVVTGGLAVLALLELQNRAHRRWRWWGVAASAGACGLWMIDIWVGSGSDVGFIVYCVLLTVAALVAHANVCLMCALNPEQHWLRLGTILVALTCGVLVDMIAVNEKTRFLARGTEIADLLERLAAATGIVAACGTLAMFVLARFNRKVDLESSDGVLESIELRCPRCRAKQVLQIGNSLCSSCGLRISIRVEEPRCPRCDYLLLHLTSNRCPECGEAFAPATSDAAKAPSLP